ncbi:hypothetical protein BOTBODRAFT_185755 [Botryobasidium botryosum FD-172 SS1]|uniref:Uncharacterized protein n=1 Tax=Botryobasidium botryosum (strain FD-172 SS1) TaxID=930990 RepID=A0A067MSG3_BOTB1|nr:hypothetical protein BOTBODRAFT_185755 [Botryobasidium botryosum FD-172 SS1]
MHPPTFAASSSQAEGNLHPTMWSKHAFLNKYPPRTVEVKAGTPSEWIISQNLYKNLSESSSTGAAVAPSPVRPDLGFQTASNAAEPPAAVDRTGYPWFELYPKVETNTVEALPELVKDGVPAPATIPNHHASGPCDRTGYPWFELYPRVEQSQANATTASDSAEPISRIPKPPFTEKPAGCFGYLPSDMNSPAVQTSGSTQSPPKFAVDPRFSNAESSCLDISDTECPEFASPNTPPPQYNPDSYEHGHYGYPLFYPPTSHLENMLCRAAVLSADDWLRTRQRTQVSAPSKGGAKRKIRKILRSKRAAAAKCCRTVWGAVVLVLDRLGPTRDDVFLH